ncbi:cdc42 effector protein 1 [Platysternon megacephalum]|uniref:Cdc42 effector protein 1 n=1 Tax=Platysternon megacephalum TaxID=55544 RepID=A0A4D9E9X6_9SAUR|nr:cdc42 effector protein 1 [Platysternon megacephalum]
MGCAALCQQPKNIERLESCVQLQVLEVSSLVVRLMLLSPRPSSCTSYPSSWPQPVPPRNSIAASLHLPSYYPPFLYSLSFLPAPAFQSRFLAPYSRSTESTRDVVSLISLIVTLYLSFGT